MRTFTFTEQERERFELLYDGFTQGAPQTGGSPALLALHTGIMGKLWSISVPKTERQNGASVRLMLSARDAAYTLDIPAGSADTRTLDLEEEEWRAVVAYCEAINWRPTMAPAALEMLTWLKG